MTLGNGYVAIRDLHEDGGPAAPEAWARTSSAGGWTVIDHPPSALTLAACRVNVIGARGLFALFGPQDVLEALADGNAEIMPARELWRRRAETQARKAIRAWRTWIVDVDGEVEVRRTLVTEGEILSATPPTVGAPWAIDGASITRLYRPALDTTLAGYTLHITLEDQPDRGA